MSYFRLEHYVPARVMEKLDLSYIKEELPKLHSTYVGASEKETELEFLKVSGQQLASLICDLRNSLWEYGCMDFKQKHRKTAQVLHNTERKKPEKIFSKDTSLQVKRNHNRWEGSPFTFFSNQ